MMRVCQLARRCHVGNPCVHQGLRCGRAVKYPQLVPPSLPSNDRKAGPTPATLGGGSEPGNSARSTRRLVSRVDRESRASTSEGVGVYLKMRPRVGGVPPPRARSKIF